MADQVNGTEKTPEEIERDMLQTRESLTEKVAALESQVVGTVQTAADTLSDTVEAVKSFVQTAPEAVSESVKQASAAVSDALKGTFDVTGHVRANPWAAVGVSAAVGALVGYLTAAPRRGLMEGLSESDVSQAGAARSLHSAAPQSPARPGVLDDLRAMLGGKLRELAETALNSLSGAVKTTLETRVPHLIDEAAAAVVDRTREPEPTTISGRFDARRTSGS